MYIYQERKSAFVLYSLLSAFFFIGDKITCGHFKDAIIPSLEPNDRLNFSQEVAMNHVREKVKPQCKLSYKVFKGGKVYDPLLNISKFSKLSQLKDFLGGIQHGVTVVGKWVLIVIFFFCFLFIIKIWINVALMIMNQK